VHLLHHRKVRKTKIHVTDIAVVARFSSNPGVSEYHVVAQMSLGEALLPATILRMREEISSVQPVAGEANVSRRGSYGLRASGLGICTSSQLLRVMLRGLTLSAHRRP
jgi:hypothetical protein